MLDTAINIWADWMWNCTWQVLVLLAIVLVADRLLRHRVWPQLLMCLWACVLLKLLLPPQLGSPVSVTQTMIGESGAPRIVEPLLSGSMSMTFKGLAFAAWLIGCAAIGGLYITRYLRTTAHLRECTTAPSQVVATAERIANAMDIRRRISVKVCPRITMPGMFGIFRPVIVLLTDLAATPVSPVLEPILVHELAHVRRGDAAFRVLTHTVLIAYWFNPALILLRRRLATLQELCCDATALSHMRETRRDYVVTLLQMGRRLLNGRPSTMATPLLSLFDGPTGLDERIRYLKETPRRLSSRQRKWIGMIALIAFKVAVFPMGNPHAIADTWEALLR